VTAAAAPDQITLGRKLNRVVFSRQSDHWSTPDHVYSTLDAEFGFTFDPCPLRSPEDGAKIKWTGRVFCNPPYSAIRRFIEKGLFHLAQGDCEVLVYLIPARTDTAWFHDYCAEAEIRFIRGRLKFGGSKNSAPFPSMLVVFRDFTLPASLLTTQEAP
jgi:phage N-6-adenine-methyltransferase